MRYRLTPPPQGVEVLYRAVAQRYSYIIDAEAERYGTTDPELIISWHVVTKRTKCGAWIMGGTKFVNLTKNKKFACNTVEEAIESFRKRKEAQICILQKQLSNAFDELELVTNPKKGLAKC